MVGGDKTEDNTEDLQGLVPFSPVVTGGALSDSRGDSPVCLADCSSDRLFLSLSGPPFHPSPPPSLCFSLEMQHSHFSTVFVPCSLAQESKLEAFRRLSFYEITAFLHVELLIT